MSCMRLNGSSSAKRTRIVCLKRDIPNVAAVNVQSRVDLCGSMAPSTTTVRDKDTIFGGCMTYTYKYLIGSSCAPCDRARSMKVSATSHISRA